MVIKQLDGSYFGEIKRMFREVFGMPPWNEDWSDDAQLENYIRDLTEVRNPIVLGLFEDDALIGFSIGRIKHWCGGTEYFIEELCLRAEYHGRGYGREFFSLIEGRLKELGLNSVFLVTDRNMPAYGFYRHIGFTELPELAAFFKEF